MIRLYTLQLFKGVWNVNIIDLEKMEGDVSLAFNLQ